MLHLQPNDTEKIRRTDIEIIISTINLLPVLCNTIMTLSDVLFISVVLGYLVSLYYQLAVFNMALPVSVFILHVQIYSMYSSCWLFVVVLYGFWLKLGFYLH